MSEPTPISELPAHLDRVERALSAAPGGPPASRPWWCPVCSRQAAYGTTHDACKPKAILADRKDGLRGSYATIPAMFREATFATVEGRIPKLAIGRATAATDNLEAAPRVIFSGPAGCGKTTLAICMLRRLIDRALDADAAIEHWRRASSVLFVDAHDLAGARAAAPLGAEAPLVKRCLGVSVLVIDELGGEPEKTPRNAIPDVLHKRHKDPSKWTIVTTGLDEKTLVALYGDGIVRRLFEGAPCIKPAGLF